MVSACHAKYCKVSSTWNNANIMSKFDFRKVLTLGSLVKPRVSARAGTTAIVVQGPDEQQGFWCRFEGNERAYYLKFELEVIG